MAFPKRARESAGGSFQKQQHPNSKRHKPTKPIEPLEDQAEESVEVDLEGQEASLKTYIHHAVKLLSKAIKTSKQFEVQKVARKLKQAREPKDGAVDEAVVTETEAQLNAIKAISPDAFAPTLLSTRIGKLGFLRPHATALQAALASPSTSNATEPDGKSPEGKARNRLLTNKVLKEAWEEVSRAMAKRCGQEVEARKEKEPVKTKQTPAAAATPAAAKAPVEGEEVVAEEPAAEAASGEPVKRLSKRAERAAKAAITKANLPKRSMNIDPSRLAALAAAGGDQDEDEDEDEGSQADDESEDEGPVSGSEYGDDDSELEREMARLGGSGDESDLEGPDSDADDSGDDSEAGSDAPPAKKVRIAPAPTRQAKPSKDRKPVTSSAFLPSLASGYVSYSDSEGEDAKRDRDFDKVEKKERKNRRGQRARQAIWEKKYGSGAKHVAKANGLPAAPAKGTKAAKTKAGKAATAAAEAEPEKLDGRYQPFDPAKAAGRPGQAPNPNAVPVAERKAVRPPPAVMAGEKMHPSWEAKRRAAEQAVLVKDAPKGKKITFD